MIDEHAQAVLDLLDADNAAPALVFYDGKVPTGVIPPYVVVYFEEATPGFDFVEVRRMALITVARPRPDEGLGRAGAAVAASDTIAASDIGTSGVLLNVINGGGGSINVTISDPNTTAVGNAGHHHGAGRRERHGRLVPDPARARQPGHRRRHGDLLRHDVRHLQGHQGMRSRMRKPPSPSRRPRRRPRPRRPSPRRRPPAATTRSR
jgi:hypothetical protein